MSQTEIQVELPDSPAGLRSVFTKAITLLEQQFYDRAMVEFSRAMKMDRNKSSKVITEVYKQAQEGGNLERLVSVGANVLAQTPKNVELANLLGNSNRKLGNNKQAMVMYKHCLKVDPKYALASYNLAATLAGLELCDDEAIQEIAHFEALENFQLPDNNTEEIEEFTRIHYELYPEELEAREKIIEDRKKAKEKAKKDALAKKRREEEEREEASPWDSISDMAAAEDRGEVFEEKKKEEIDEEEEEPEEEEEEEPLPPPVFKPKRLLKRIFRGKDEEKKPRQYLALGVYCLQKKFPEEANACFGQLLKQDKTNLDHQCFKILADTFEKGKDEGIKALTALLREHKTHRYSLVNLGYLSQCEGNAFQARQYYFMGYKLLKRSMGYYNITLPLILARKLDNEGNYKEALEIYNPLIDEIDAVELLKRIGALYQLVKAPDEAAKTFKRILKITPKDEEVRQALREILEFYQQRADALLKKNDSAGAAEILEKCIDILPKKSTLIKAIAAYQVLKNYSRVTELQKRLDAMIAAEIKKQLKMKMSEAKAFEDAGKFTAAFQAYEEALYIDPKQEISMKLADMCKLMEREDMVEKITLWFRRLYERRLGRLHN